MTNNPEIHPKRTPADIGPFEDVSEATQSRITEIEDATWFKRHRLGLGIAGVALAGALSVTQFDKTVGDVENAAHWAVPALFTTETAAWSGAALMLLSAGKKLGNPLTVKKRLTQIASELEANTPYKTGFAINVSGAAGTSVVIMAGALTSLPATSWPLAAGAAGASLAFSALPLKNAGKKNAGNAKEKA